MNKVIVVGGGAAGMMAAIAASSRGCGTVILEKNEKTGKKLYITGKGRCNLMNDCDEETFLKNVVTNPRFLYSSIYGLGPSETRRMFEDMGLSLKTERGSRVFPVSDKSSDVIKALNARLRELGVKVLTGTAVSSVEVKNGRAAGVILSDGTHMRSDAVILATGGLSYPLTGSTGDGLRIAEETGHRVIPCIPSLTGLNLQEG
ncbi:MAG: aminoacetone oxidase family FAD-binding enzyme, partial [Lachnospiraceae bacterium]|nr:aminoacetone oxidase family FAD-binding enzyme [Lachnospiraceae bacterium]